jgi:hypothetical protein
MSIFKIITGTYGFQLIIQIFHTEMNLRIHKRFDTEFTLGIRNSTPDGKRVIFLDYDQILFDEELIPELEFLQKKYELSDFYILRSSQKVGNYHAICLDKMKAREWVKLIEETTCDNNYKKIPVLAGHRNWVLRCWKKGDSQKPKLLRILYSPHHKRTKSLAHAMHLHYMYGIRIEKLIKLDNNKQLGIVNYKTLNFIRHKKR